MQESDRKRPTGIGRWIEAQAVEGGRGDEPALEATERLLDPATLDAARLDRRVMERAFLFAECAVDNLADIASGMRTAGHLQLADRIGDGLVIAADEGLARISIVRDFPVALVGYGYTREYPTPAVRGSHRYRMGATTTGCLLLPSRRAPKGSLSN